MIYVDIQGHMISDVGDPELKTILLSIGVKPNQYIDGRLPRYNLSESQVINALILGVRLISTRELVGKLRCNRMNNMDDRDMKIYKGI